MNLKLQLVEALNVLRAILVAGFGRSGSTALMSLLATAPGVMFDRVYPFENRHLTYLAKLALLLERQDPSAGVPPPQLFDFANTAFGANPWGMSHFAPTATQWLRGLWETFSTRAASLAPGSDSYAEKAPHWLPALARECLNSPTIYLFRDPRDIFLSANAFMKKRGSLGFDRSPEDTDADYARTLAHRFLSYYENYQADHQRPDCLMLKYEDMILRADQLLPRLEQQFGIDCRWGTSPWLEVHRTTRDLGYSVGRWQREPLPTEVDSILREYLGPAMAHLGYLAGPSSIANTETTVDFRSGAGDPTHILCYGGQLIPQPDSSTAVVATGDFWVVPPVPPFDAATVREIWVCIKGAVGEVCSVYWRAAHEDFSEDRSTHVPYSGGPHWQVLRLPVGSHPRWMRTIAQLRIDLFNLKTGSPYHPLVGFVKWLRMMR